MATKKSTKAAPVKAAAAKKAAHPRPPMVGHEWIGKEHREAAKRFALCGRDKKK